MNLLYRFETSEKVRSVQVDVSPVDVSLVVSLILKKLFKGKEPSCDLELVSSDDVLKSNNSKAYVFKRVYRNKFLKTEKKVEKKIKKRKRRWRSPVVEPFRRRWRSKSPSRR